MEQVAGLIIKLHHTLSMLTQNLTSPPHHISHLPYRWRGGAALFTCFYMLCCREKKEINLVMKPLSFCEMQLVWPVLEKRQQGWAGQDSEQMVVSSCQLSVGHSECVRMCYLCVLMLGVTQ